MRCVLASLAAVVMLALLPAGHAAAEAGLGPPVAANAAVNAPLGATIRARVGVDVAEDVIDATVRPSVVVAGRTVTTLEPATFPGLTGPTPTSYVIAVPARALRDVRVAARRAEVDEVKLVFHTSGTYARTGEPAPPGVLSTVLSLRPPDRSGRRIVFASRGQLIGGREAYGSITAPTPTGWGVTSKPRSTLQTFAAVRLGPSCSADVQAIPFALAVRSLSRAALTGLGDDMVAGTVLRSARSAMRGSAVFEQRSLLRANGLVRVAARRFLGVRVYARVDSTCPPSALRDPALVRGVSRLAAGVRADVRLRPLRRS